MKVEEGVVSALFRCHRLILLSLDDYNSCKLPRDLQTTPARLLSAQKYAADCRCALTDTHDCHEAAVRAVVTHAAGIIEYCHHTRAP